MKRLQLSQFANQQMTIQDTLQTLGGTIYNNFCSWYMNIVSEPNPALLNLFMTWDNTYSNIRIDWDEHTNTLVSISVG